MTSEQKNTCKAIAEEMDALNINRSVIEVSAEQDKRIRTFLGFRGGFVSTLSLWGGLMVRIFPNGYGGAEYEYWEGTKEPEHIVTKYTNKYKKPISDELCEVLIEVSNEIIAARKAEIAVLAANKPLAEVKGEIQEYVHQFVADNYDGEYKTEVYECAKRAYDSAPREVIIILGRPFRPCDQVGSIQLGQDKFGQYGFSCAAPCCGEWGNHFTMENYKEKMEECVKWVIPSRYFKPKK